jgi:DNA-binding transcriptional MerR regulator
MDDAVMTIRQMCDAFDVTPRTLRFYEAKELLLPVREGQKRLYTRKERARLKLILRGKRFGFSLEEIRQLLDMYTAQDAGEKQRKGTLAGYKLRLQEFQQQELELKTIIAELEEQIDWMHNNTVEDI